MFGLDVYGDPYQGKLDPTLKDKTRIWDQGFFNNIFLMNLVKDLQEALCLRLKKKKKLALKISVEKSTLGCAWRKYLGGNARLYL